MTQDQCYLLGKITKPFGVKGQMMIFLDVDCPEDYADLDSAFVEIKGKLIPYFFHIDNLNGNKAVVTFEEITSEEALALAGRDLYLPLDLLPKLTGNSFTFTKWWDLASWTKRMATSASSKASLNIPPSPCSKS